MCSEKQRKPQTKEPTTLQEFNPNRKENLTKLRTPSALIELN